MTAKMLELPVPTPSLVRSHVEQFDQAEAVTERVLRKVFSLFPTNDSIDDMFLKVVVLNDLYRTGILAKYRVAEHILRASVDPLISTGDVDAVERITPVRIGTKIRRNYSFATKYCAWHNSNEYPIYDTFVDQMLWLYKKWDNFTDFQHQELLIYREFKRVMLAFREFYNLSEFSLKDLDKFLWRAGQKHFPPPWSKSAP